jgi:predicted esterase
MKRNHANPPTRLQVPVSIPLDAEVRLPLSRKPKEVLILLHGFAESGARILRKLEAGFPGLLAEQTVIWSPNAPFPAAHKKEEGYSLTFSWYFYDPAADEYFIDMSPAIEFIQQGLEMLGWSDLPKRVVGFSQGGYLGLVLCGHLRNVRQFVGVGCDFLVDEFPGRLPESAPDRVDGVHGAQDDIVSPSQSRASHARLLQAGVEGKFELVEGSGHRIDDRIRDAVGRALAR